MPQEKYFLCKTVKDTVRRGKAEEFVSDLRLGSEFAVSGIPSCGQKGTGSPHAGSESVLPLSLV